MQNSAALISGNRFAEPAIGEKIRKQWSDMDIKEKLEYLVADLEADKLVDLLRPLSRSAA